MIPHVNLDPWRDLRGDASPDEEESKEKRPVCICGCEFEWHSLLESNPCYSCSCGEFKEA